MIVGDMEIRLRADIARLQRDMNQARQVVGDTAAGIGRAADQMKAALAAIGLGAGLAQIIQMSDEYTKFTAQLRLATLSQREYAQALADVKRISTDAQSSMAGAGTLYARIANGTRDLGVSQKQVADITETVSLALKVSGATAEESASAMLQLSQSFASGTLRGEEFNAVNEAAPRLMKALADGMGVPVGALKDMASNGLITSKIMADVLPQALEKLRTESAQIQTISGAMQVLKDRFMEFTAVQAQTNGMVSLLTAGIGVLANNLTLVTGVVSTLAAVNVVNWLTAWVAKTYERITAAYAQVAAENAVRAASLAAIETEVARAAADVAVATATQSAILVAREEVVVRLAQANSNIVAASAAVEAATAAGAQSFALRTLRAATTELAAAEAARTAELSALAVLGQQQARVSAQITAATAAQAASQTALNTASAVGSTAAGVAGRALGLLGGPIGAVVTLLGLAATAWSVWGAKAEQGNQQAAESFDEAQARIIKGLDEQIAKNEKLIQLQSGGMNKDKAEKNLAVLDQLAAASRRLDDINTRSGDFAPDKGKSNDDILFARLKVLRDIDELGAKMQKRDATADAAAAVGPAAQALVAVRERLTGVNKQYLDDLKALQTARESNAIGEKEYVGLVAALATETYKKSEAGKDSIAGMKKEETAYESLISSIRSKISENQAELNTGKDATESEKTAIKITEELASGKLKLSAAHKDVLASALAQQAASEQALKAQTAQGDVTKFIAASTTARSEAAKALDVEYAAYGKTTDARDMEMVAVKSQADTQKKLDDLQVAKLPITDQIIAQLKSEEAARTLVGQATLGQTKALQYAASLKADNERFAAESIADPKARADALLAIDDRTWKERIKLAGDGTEAQRILQAEYGTWYANQQKRLTSEVDVTRATELLKIMEAVDDAARQAAQGMADSFGAVGKAVGDLTTALTGYQRAQATIAAQLAASLQDAKGDPTKVARAQAVAAQQSAQAQIKSYGDMASAAKGFFSENSKGYKILETTERAFRAYEMAMALESMVKKIFFKEGEVAANVALNATKLTGEATTSAASTSLAATEASAWGVTAVVKALASLPFPANLAAGAATLAAVIAIGAKLVGGLGGGSGGGQSAADVQKAQGTGSVFGDSSAKSDSIRRSIEQLTANSSDMLPINQGMLTALQNIESSMTGLTNLVVRTTGLTDGANMGIQTGTIATGGVVALAGSAQVGSMIGGALAGPLGVWIGGAIGGAVSKLWGKTTQNIVDSGLQYGGSVRSLQQGQGFDQYASIDTTKSSFFGLSKSTSNRVEVQGLNDELSKQFGLIFTNLDKSLQAAATAMGGSAGDVTKVLDNLTLESTKVSLKGLTGTALTDALNSVISKSMDEIAEAAFPQLDQFRQVGEGYAETVMRIAGDYAKLDAILAASSTTFGATGMASIAARERLIELAGGIDQLASQSNSFTSNFLSKAEQLAPVQKYVTDQLAAMGLQSLDTRDKFKDYVLGLANSGALATEAGAQQYAALLALADAFAKTHAATVDLTKSEQEIADERTDLQNKLDELTMTEAQLAEKARAAIDAHNLALYDQVVAAQAAKDATKALLGDVDTAYSNLQAVVGTKKDALNAIYQSASDGLQASIDSVTASVTKLQSLSDSLHSTLDSMTIPGQEMSDRAAAQAQIEAALVIAKAGGPLPDADSLKNALATVSKDASGQFASYTDYMRDLYRTKNSVGALSGLTDTQLSAEQQTLKTLQAQKAALDAAHKAELAALDATLDQAKTQTDLLHGIYSSLMTLPQALAALGGAVSQASANPGVSKDTVTALYEGLLGRAPEAAGLAFWQLQFSNGASIDAIKSAIMSSSEYQSLHPPGFASGGFHAGGLRVVGENGPEIEATGPSRIWNASQMRDAMSGGSNADLVAELRALRSEMAEMRATSARTAASSEESTKLFKRVIRNDKLYTEATPA
ncbi:tape measure protein [Pseudoduganella sp. FT26W]|uniref:Tape measure protein n=1 Tax=Duganella aquatilis TaxID=2666082 RepID=A0A844DD50_9BURK|nr:tape measure protein [Duganella aquatilis]MRW85414.1 tape measure protein [Duganella aquatilis]